MSSLWNLAVGLCNQSTLVIAFLYTILKGTIFATLKIFSPQFWGMGKQKAKSKNMGFKRYNLLASAEQTKMNPFLSVDTYWQSDSEHYEIIVGNIYHMENTFIFQKLIIFDILKLLSIWTYFYFYIIMRSELSNFNGNFQVQ